VVRIEIDPNVRVRAPDGTRNATFSDLADATGPVAPGEHVTAFEPESGLEWPARILAVERGLVFLRPEWSEYRETA
jgi:hypothetical protein